MLQRWSVSGGRVTDFGFLDHGYRRRYCSRILGVGRPFGRSIEPCKSRWLVATYWMVSVRRMEAAMMAHELDETDPRRVICEAGRSAVLKGREIWGGLNDNDMREEFLSALIAVELHNTLRTPIRTELQYLAMYRSFAAENPDEITQRVRADVVIGEMKGDHFIPTAIVEIKKFAEGASVANILADLDKGVSLAQRVGLYAGVFVCETPSTKISEREEMLKQAHKGEVFFSKRVKALSGEWYWSFACLQRPAAEVI